MKTTWRSANYGRVVVVTGADAYYYWLLEGAIRSLLPGRDKFGFDIIVLDFGLTEEQSTTLREEYQVRVIRPEWIVNVAEKFKVPRNLAFGTRCVLPTIIPSYDVYCWFDSDGWVQDEGFYERYIGTASAGAVAVVREEEPVYRFDWGLLRWNLGNQMLAFGPWQGPRVFFSPAINNGFVAARGDHPVWDLWRSRFEAAVRKSGKIIMDQHSLKAAIVLDKVKTHYLAGESNWICSRARPFYDRDRGCFCLPYPPHKKIEIMHLAGPGKDLEYQLECVNGGTFDTVLTFDAASQSAPRTDR